MLHSVIDNHSVIALEVASSRKPCIVAPSTWGIWEFCISLWEICSSYRESKPARRAGRDRSSLRPRVLIQ